MGEKSEQEIIADAQRGDDAGLWALLDSYRPRIRRMVDLRLQPMLRGRIDASDVIQDSFLEVSARIDEYLQKPKVPFFIWVRFLSTQKLAQLHRRHIGTAARDARREVSLEKPATPEASSLVLARGLADSGTSPSGAAIRGEETERLREALDTLKEGDREILALRDFEHLSNGEAAGILGISEAAASQRYFRALERLRDLLEARP